MFPLSLNLFSREKKLSLRGLDRARASPSTRALSKPDADLAAALAAHEATSHLVAGWPASGEDGGGRDDLKARLLSAVRSRLAAPGTAGAGEGGRGGTEEGDEEQQLESLRQSILVAPAPQKRPRQLENASDPAAPPRADDYYWLRDDTRKAKDVLSHLAAENAYVAASLADTNGVKDKITKELRAAIQEADEGAPVRKAGYWWWWRTKEVGFSPSSTPPPLSSPSSLPPPLRLTLPPLSLSRKKRNSTRPIQGGEYRQHVRRKVSKSALSRPPTERDAAALVEANAARAAGGAAAAPAGKREEEEAEEVFLDEDARAAGKSFYMTGGVTASPDGSALAWGEDTEGGEKYTLHCVDLRSGEPLLRRPIPSTAGNFVFSSPPPPPKEKSDDPSSPPSNSPSSSEATACTSTHLFYSTKDALDRPHKVWRHRLGSDPAADVCVFHETDDAFYVSVGRTRDGALVLVSSGSAITTEVLALKADEPESELVLLLPRVHDVEYDVGSHSAAGRVRAHLDSFLFFCRVF